MTNKIQKKLKYVLDRDMRFLLLSENGLYNKMNDEDYLKRKYKAKFKRDLNLDNPKSFNEKLQWLKLYNRKEEYTRMVDKYAVKEYVSDVIGEKYIIPTLGVWEKFDDIDFDRLPNQFVLKCTHDSGGLVICRNKASLNISKSKKKINKSLKRNFYYLNREWPYKNVKPRIIAEKYLEDSYDDNGNGQLTDYKIFCFNGVAKFIMIASDRHSSSGAKTAYFDRNFKKIDNLRWGHNVNNKAVTKPQKLDEMILLAEKLSHGIPHVRMDFYLINNRIYFGEMTFFDGGGFDVIEPYEKDLEFGSLIDLPDKHD